MRRPLEEYRLLRMQMDRLSQIAEADQPGTAFEQLEMLVHDLGFDYLIVGVMQGDYEAQSLNLDYASTPLRQSLDEYLEKGMDRVDPIGAAVISGVRGFTIDEFAKRIQPERKNDLHQVIKQMQTAKIDSHGVLGFSMPTATAGGCLALGNYDGHRSADMQQRFWKHSSVLRLAGFACFRGLITAQGNERPNLLSGAEQKVVNHLGAGLTPREIAEEEQKALSTVRQQINSARDKLGARTVPQALAMAQALGLIRRR